MNPIIRNILAIIAGIIIGSFVNMGIIMVSGSIIPPPDGADVTTSEGLKASMHLFQPRHFIFPFLAHALGTFTGAFAAALIAANHKMKFAMGIGVFFFSRRNCQCFHASFTRLVYYSRLGWRVLTYGLPCCTFGQKATVR